jgi:hypothetical protein
MRSAAQPGPAPPIACCSTRARRRKIRRDSNIRWMKVQGQVTLTKAAMNGRAPMGGKRHAASQTISGRFAELSALAGRIGVMFGSATPPSRAINSRRLMLHPQLGVPPTLCILSLKPGARKGAGGYVGDDQSMSGMGQSRHFDCAPLTSGLPQLADILSGIRHVSKVPTCDIAYRELANQTPR